MKFEKFLKGVGTHGKTLTRDNGDNWLLSGGVGMKIPTGVTNLLGSTIEKPNKYFNEILGADTTDDILNLSEAVLFDPTGKSGDIVRVFETEMGDRVGIWNTDYGLLEKSDILTYLEVEDENNEGETKTIKLIVVLGFDQEIKGFITGTQRI